MGSRTPVICHTKYPKSMTLNSGHIFSETSDERDDLGECWPGRMSYETGHVSRLETLTKMLPRQLGRL